MLTFWSLVLVWNFGQNPKTDKPGEPEKKPAATQKAEEKAGKAAAADPKAPPPEPDSEFDKFVRAEAAKLDKLTSVSAEIVYISRNQDQLATQKGVFKLGPNNRVRLELAFGDGPTGGKRSYVCDGASSYKIEEFGELRRCELVKMDRIKPLLDDKNMTDEVRTQIWGGLVPFQKPGEALRALLGTMTFTEKRDDKLGDRAVVRLEGRWRKVAVSILTGGDASKTFDDIDPRVPRFVSLVLDKQTGWPLQIELFQRIPEGLIKPYVTIKFSKLTIGAAIPESDFKFTPPSNMTSQDMTPMIESGLKRFLDQAAAQNAAKVAADKKASPPEAPKKP